MPKPRLYENVSGNPVCIKCDIVDEIPGPNAFHILCSRVEFIRQRHLRKDTPNGPIPASGEFPSGCPNRFNLEVIK